MAAWFLLKAVGRRMRERKSGGSIIFMTTFIRVNAIARGLHLDDEFPRWVGKEQRHCRDGWMLKGFSFDCHLFNQ
ncbi:hypothetical protein F3Y22_tig00110378pilonHSYRG00110 [Hibiscus syriacus]|uniref:Uncharacterized protein n=1 Tax=Hibiscus syriacus TaxID=106335 RepID=A0A6A3ASJ5_HIBSY|nr:hypothetical protein F3Y22_tig00110378pilonHSYRG00110 [Hibiscus syriacus]